MELSTLHAGSPGACQDRQLVEAILGFALGVQQAALSGRSKSALPAFALLPWVDARALVQTVGQQAGQGTLELLLQVMLAVPPPHTVRSLPSPYSTDLSAIVLMNSAK